MARPRKTATTEGVLKAPSVRIRQRKNESKRDFQKRVKEYKKTNAKWIEYNKQKKSLANKKYYEKKKEYISKWKKSNKEHWTKFEENYNIKGFGTASVKTLKEFFLLLNKYKTYMALAGDKFVAEQYDEVFQDFGGNATRTLDVKEAIKKLEELLQKAKEKWEEQQEGLTRKKDRGLGKPSW